MRFFLVDRVDAITPGTLARGVKNVSLSDEILQDHFPDHPLFPGTLIVEALAQLGGFLVECTVNRGDAAPQRAVLAQIEKARFHRPCRPGDQLVLDCRLGSCIGSAAQVQAEASIGGEKAATALLTFALRSDAPPLVHEQRRRLYQTWTQSLVLDFPLR